MTNHRIEILRDRVHYMLVSLLTKQRNRTHDNELKELVARTRTQHKSMSGTETRNFTKQHYVYYSTTLDKLERDIKHYNGDYVFYSELGVIDRLREEIEKHDRPGKISIETIREESEVYIDDRLIPSKIKGKLDEYAVGQDEVKKALAVYVANHYNSIQGNDEAMKQALLIIGQSGTGKTLLVNSLGRILDKEVKTIDITEYSQEGYVGKSLSSLPEEMRSELKDPENSILFIDEVDKLNDMLDMGKSVQYGLLKLIEGANKTHTGKGIYSSTSEVDFSKVCIVLGGAFTSIFDKKKKEDNKRGIGFDANVSGKKKTNKHYELTHEDLVESGVQRELIGRIGNLVSTKPLTKDAWYDIITKPKNCILEHYNKLFKDNNIKDLVSTEDVKAIIKKSKGVELGVRGLWAIAATHFRDRLYY